MADQQDASLLDRTDSQTSVENVGNTSRRTGPSDLKIAGFAVLVCMLLASLGLTAYFGIYQNSQISGLQKTTDLLKMKLTQMPQGSASSKMIHMPLYSSPLMSLDVSEDDSPKKTPTKKPEDTVAASVSLEKQVKDLLKDLQLPQFNETFLDNLQALRQQMQKPEWKEFESWMYSWLIFQMAQKKPPEPTPTPIAAAEIKTKCQLEAAKKTKVGLYRPQCDEQGQYKPMQCWHSTGYCWCVDQNGEEIPSTMVRGKPMCGGMAVAGRRMAMPSLSQLMENEDSVE